MRIAELMREVLRARGDIRDEFIARIVKRNWWLGRGGGGDSI